MPISQNEDSYIPSNEAPIQKEAHAFVAKHETDFKKRYGNGVMFYKSTESENINVPWLREQEFYSAIVLFKHNLWKEAKMLPLFALF